MHHRRPSISAALCIAVLLAAAAEGLPPPPERASRKKGAAAAESLRLDLIRNAAACDGGGGDGSRLDYYRSAAAADRGRREALLRRWQGGGSASACSGPAGAAAPAPAPAPESFSTPISSGAFAGTGQYFVRFQVGTPEQTFQLVADTGSDLTWMSCVYNGTDSSPSSPAPAPAIFSGGGERAVFSAVDSRSFRPINCSSYLCKNTLPFSLTACPTPSSPCEYNYSYIGGATAVGFYANESSTIELTGGGAGGGGRREKLKGLVIGCTSSSSGSGFVGSDGVLGLGYSPISFAVHAAARFSGRFSYCLVDHLSPRNVSGSLVFGPNPALRRRSAPASAPLLVEAQFATAYSVAVAAISVAGEALDIPPAVWSSGDGGGVVFDSGSTLTLLAQPAYDAVTAALSLPLSGVPAANVPEGTPFEFCYNWSSLEAAAATVPSLEVAFVGSARLRPPAKSYLIDVAPGLKCIGITPGPWPGPSTFGNILQQEHLWEFDLRRMRLRFQPSNCTAGVGGVSV